MQYSRRSLAQLRTKLLPDGHLDDVPFEDKLTSHGMASLTYSRAPEMASRVTPPHPFPRESAQRALVRRAMDEAPASAFNLQGIGREPPGSVALPGWIPLIITRTQVSFFKEVKP